MELAEYAERDGLGLAERVARGETSPEELAEAAFAAVEVLNPRLNAVLQVLREEAGAQIRAGLPAGPFRGVPFLLKELVCHAAGVRLDMGSRLAKGFVAPHDTELMARFRRAGLVLAGTTQTPELGYNPTTEPVLFGPVRNPWDPARSAGGSSGGAGAAVAAGIVPLAHANDGGGSIRIPAACNGLVGLKPTRDRVPTGPDYADPLCGLAIELAVTRSVRDAAAILDAVAGPDVGAPSLLPRPERPFREALEAPLAPLRVAWSTRSPSGGPVDPECVRAVEETVRALGELGLEAVEAAPPLDWEPFLEATHVVWTSYTAATADAVGRAVGRTPSPESLEAVTWACYEDGRGRSAPELLAALAHMNTVSRSVAEFFERYDVLVTPTTARPAAPLGELDQNDAGLTAAQWTRTVFDYVPFTPLFNTTGQPALSLPLHWTPGGLPVGVQLAGRFAEEATLLALAARLEAARPWAGRRPPIHAAGG